VETSRIYSPAGIATDLPAGAMAFLRSPYAESLPDVQFIFISAPMTGLRLATSSSGRLGAASPT